MRTVTCSLGVSLDGYAIGPDGRFDWSRPDEEEFKAATDEVRWLGVHLMGSRLYEAMRYWDGRAEDPELDAPEREFARLWAALPKVVLSTSLTSVADGYELAQGTLAEEVARWQAVPGEGAIAIGGATLAAAAADLGLVDEWGVRVHPVLVGGGTPLFPRTERRADLELLALRTFGNGVLHLRYGVRR